MDYRLGLPSLGLVASLGLLPAVPPARRPSPFSPSPTASLSFVRLVPIPIPTRTPIPTQSLRKNGCGWSLMPRAPTGARSI